MTDIRQWVLAQREGAMRAAGQQPRRGERMTHFRLRWEKRGAHVHVRFFAAPWDGLTHGCLGGLCFRESEWESFLRCFNDHGADKVTVLPEDGEP